jgi:NADH-quinone oxidoreductase subunit N
VPSVDYHAILPVLLMGATVLVVLVVDAFLPRRHAWFGMPLSLAGAIASLVAVLTLVPGPDRIAFGGHYVVDGFTLLFQAFFLIVAIVVLALSLRYMREGGFYQGEYYFLLMTAFLGCVLMPASRDLLMLFISLELVSAPGFLMAAFRKGDLKGNEGGLKFFIIGVLSTAVMLYGMSMIIGLTGETQLHLVAEGLAGLQGAQLTLADASILFVVVGFGFKVSAVPFQFWAPDTYEGSPVPVAAFLAVASKAAGFAGLLQLMFVAFPGEAEFWAPLFAILSILTMTLGNLVALKQTQFVRLLAYSGIAQAGYMLLPFALVSTDQQVNDSAFSATVTYILIYGIMTVGAFAVGTAVARRHPRLLLSDFAGLVRSAPFLAIGMTVCMVSLAGIPPTGGFWGKLLIFQSAIEFGGYGVVLAAIMVINSVISIVYYLAVPRQMIFESADDERPLRPAVLITAVVAVAMIALVAIFVIPNALVRLGDMAVIGVGG